MNRVKLGMLTGLVLGLLDGLSAFYVSEAQDMMTMIIVGGTVKGLITGLLVGLIARSVGGAGIMALAGVVAGGVLSVLAAIPTGSYVEIVPSGIVIGLVVGLVVSRWGK